MKEASIKQECRPVYAPGKAKDIVKLVQAEHSPGCMRFPDRGELFAGQASVRVKSCGLHLLAPLSRNDVLNLAASAASP
jgi:hypothetical protein